MYVTCLEREKKVGLAEVVELGGYPVFDGLEGSISKLAVGVTHHSESRATNAVRPWGLGRGFGQDFKPADH